MKPTLFQLLSPGGYFGRLLAVGQTPEEKTFFILYAITGRSIASRSRRLCLKPEGIFVEPLSEAGVSTGQRDLLMYPAVLYSRGVAAGNGQQTTSIAAVLATGTPDPVDILQRALAAWDYELDPPIFTPRISACITLEGRLAMSLIKRGENGQSQRYFFPLTFEAGLGFLLTTYRGENSNPPLPFSGPPWQFSTVHSNPRDLLLEFYQSLAPKKGEDDLRVAAVSLTFSAPGCKPEGVEIINHSQSLEAKKS